MNLRTRKHRLAGLIGPRAGDEGAVLVLALIFMVVVAMLVLALLSWSGTDLNTVAAFQQGRTLNYAASSAVEKAIQDVRYSTVACGSSGLSIPVNGTTIDVWCIDSVTGTSVETEGGTAASRTITFLVCSDAAYRHSPPTCGPNQPPYSSANPSPILKVVVSYDDYNSPTQIGSSTPCSASCGANVTILSWVFPKVSI